jgi:hypothetical protein
MRPEGTVGVPHRCQNRRIMPTVSAGSGERFHQPGGTICRGMKGAMDRSGRAFIGAGQSDKIGGH